MTALEADTILYRHDHPDGYLFSAGAEVPEGWSETPEGVEPAPTKQYECTTFDAYEALLQSERAAKVILTGQAAEARAAFDNLLAAVTATAMAQAAAEHQAADEGVQP